MIPEACSQLEDRDLLLAMRTPVVGADQFVRGCLRRYHGLQAFRTGSLFHQLIQHALDFALRHHATGRRLAHRHAAASRGLALGLYHLCSFGHLRKRDFPAYGFTHHFVQLRHAFFQDVEAFLHCVIRNHAMLDYSQQLFHHGFHEQFLR